MEEWEQGINNSSFPVTCAVTAVCYFVELEERTLLGRASPSPTHLPSCFELDRVTGGTVRENARWYVDRQRAMNDLIDANANHTCDRLGFPPVNELPEPPAGCAEDEGTEEDVEEENEREE